MEVKNKLKKHQYKIIGAFLLIAGISLLFVNNKQEEYQVEEEKNKIETFFTTQAEIITAETKKQEENYIAILEIPKINLKKGLVNPNSQYNNIEYNIEIIDSSNFPTEENSNLILASHSGNSQISYFKNLYKLEKKDKIYLYYEGIKYEYILEEIYDTEKDGSIEISRNKDKTAITLITCKKNTDDLQIVYIGYLNAKETY